MIWSVVSKAEMEGFGTSPVFRHYREALGKYNVSLAVVEEDDNLDFVNEDDIVLLRTASESLIKTIKSKGIKSTAEDYSAYKLTSDKVELASCLRKVGIPVPNQYNQNEIEEPWTYFVKPRFGSDSFGISEKSICHTKDEVEKQAKYIMKELKEPVVIEDYINGVDCTCACVMVGQDVFTSCIDIECEEIGGIQTRDCKVEFKECCSPVSYYKETEIKRIAERVFKTLGLKHHARIDFRRDLFGNIYVIDVNLLPGLGPLDHFAKCMTLNYDWSYRKSIQMIINSASKF